MEWFFLIIIWPVYERSAIGFGPNNVFCVTKAFNLFVQIRSWHGINGMDNGL